MSNGLGWGIQHRHPAGKGRTGQDVLDETRYGSRRLAEQQAEYRNLGTLREVEVGGGRGGEVGDDEQKQKPKQKKQMRMLTGR